MTGWWTEPLRAVTLEFPASNVATLDVKGIVDETHRGAVNTLCVFSIGYYPGGTAFYQSKIAPHYPGLGERDLLAEAIEAGHRNGQKIIAYVASIWGDRKMYTAHRDWAQKKADGSTTSWDEAYNSVAMCPNSPYRRYFASVVGEISEHYAVDGFYFDEPSFQSWCSCDNCRKKFKSETGYDLPTREAWGEQVFQSFITWRYVQINRWRQELYQAVSRPDRCIFFQGAFPLGVLSGDPIKIAGAQFVNPYQERFGVDWPVPLAHATYLPDTARLGDILHFELYRRPVHEPLWWYGVTLRYGQSIGKGKQVLTLSMMGQTPFDLHGLPEAELHLSIAEILASGGAPLFARYYPDHVDQPAWDIVYDALREARRLEPYLKERRSLKYAALLFSQPTADRFDQVKEIPAHMSCMKGFAKALLQRHILFDVITDEDIVDGLDGYKVLILPNASCLSSAAREAIRSFVARGGGLVASYESGRYDEIGQPAPGDDLAGVFGLHYEGQEAGWHGFDEYMRLTEDGCTIFGNLANRPIPTGGAQVYVVPDSARVAAQVMGGAAVHYGPLSEGVGPAVILTHDYREGRAVFFAMPLGNHYLEFGTPAHRDLIAEAVLWAANGQPPARLEGAPMTVALTAYRGRDGWLVVHLVNSILEEAICPIDESLPTPPFTLELALECAPQKVSSAVTGESLSWSFDAGKLSIQIPPLKYHLVVLIEKNRT